MLFKPTIYRFRNIIGLGVDTPSTDFGQSRDFKTHQILGAANVWGLENVANLDKLPSKGATIFNMVYKLKEGSGAPSRYKLTTVHTRNCLKKTCTFLLLQIHFL